MSKSKSNVNKFDLSLMHPEFRRKVIVLAGQFGSGKTLAAASFDSPANTVLIDGDRGKGSILRDQHKELTYYPVNGNDNETLVTCGEMVLDAVTDIKLDETTVVIFDNIHEIETGIGAYAYNKPQEMARKFNLVAKRIISRSYGEAIVAEQRLMKSIVDYFIGNDITVVITAHLKDRWEAPGQKQVRARFWWNEASSLLAILRRTGGLPDALIIKHSFSYHKTIDPKELSKEDIHRYRRGEMNPTVIASRLPMRIPEFETYKLYRYLSKPLSEIKFTTDELVSMDEIKPFSEILTTEQMANLSKILEREAREAERYEKEMESARASERQEMKDNIRDMLQKNSVPEVVTLAKEKYPDFADEINPVFVIQCKGGK